MAAKIVQIWKVFLAGGVGNTAKVWEQIPQSPEANTGIWG